MPENKDRGVYLHWVLPAGLRHAYTPGQLDFPALPDHWLIVRFARDDPETPPTMDEQIALARKAAQKLGVPNCESKPLYRVGRNSHTGEAWAYVEWTREGLR